MARGNFAQKTGFGAHHVGQRLARFGVLTENHKIHRVPAAQRHADLAVGLEAANARAVARTRVNDHVRALPVEHFHARFGEDFEQLVVHWALQITPVHDQFVFVIEHRRRARFFMRLVVVAALAQHIQRQRHALGGIDAVAGRFLQQAPFLRRVAEVLLETGQAGAQLQHAAGVGFGDFFDVMRVARQHPARLVGQGVKVVGQAVFEI